MKVEQNTNDFVNLVQLTALPDDSEGFIDLIFNIITKECNGDYIKITAKATHQNQIVGLTITILNNCQPGILNNEINRDAFVRNGVIMESDGAQSDAFIEILSALYEIPSNKPFTKQKLEFTIFPLNEELGILESKSLKFKLFYDDRNEKGLYNELYLNTNLPQNWIQIREKDEEYRANIVEMFIQI